MNETNFDIDLRETAKRVPVEVPTIVKQRIDEVLISLPDSRKRKKRAIFVSAAVLVFSILVVGFGLVSPSMAQIIKQVPVLNSVLHLVDSRQMPEIREEVIGLEKAQEKAPFTIEKPTFLPEGFQEESTKLETSTRGPYQLNVAKMFFKGPGNKQLMIMQVEDTGVPDSLLSQAVKTTINGVDAWIYNPSPQVSSPNIQIMFWKDGKYYNVSGNVGQETIIKVAESLK